MDLGLACSSPCTARRLAAQGDGVPTLGMRLEAAEVGPELRCLPLQIGDDIHIISEINMFIVFLISGLVLKTADLKRALKFKLGVIYGFVAILGITPCLGFALRAIPLQPPEYALGLALFSAMPTTLGVGMSLVRSCKGNDGLALLLTVRERSPGFWGSDRKGGLGWN